MIIIFFLIFALKCFSIEICPGYWEIPQFSIRGVLGNLVVECTNMNKKGCMSDISMPNLKQSIKSRCRRSPSSEIPHLQYFDYFCDYGSLLKQFRLEMTNEFNLTCFDYYV